MENYNLSHEMLLHEIYDRIHGQLSGFGYKLRPNIQFTKIYFGDGVELMLAVKGEKAEFHWRRSIARMIEGNIRSIIGYLVFSMLYFLVGYLTHWAWSNMFLDGIYVLMLLLSIGLLIVNIPIALINSNTHLMKTQLLIREIIMEYRAKE